MRDRLAGLDRRAKDPCVGIDGERAIVGIAAGEQLEAPFARFLGERHRPPARAAPRPVGLDPDLEQGRLLVLQIIFGVGDAGPGAHHLHVAGAGAALVAHRILVGDRAGADVGDDFHVAVRMRRKAALRGDLVVVPDADPAPAHAGRVVIIGEGEMVAGIEPAVVGVAEAVEFADVDCQ